MMRRISIVFALFSTSGALLAQNWELGVSGGYSLYNNATATRGSATGSAGFSSGPVLGAVFANDMYRHFGGEARYTFIKNDLQVSSGSVKATAGGQSHAIHYDFLIHAAAKEERVRPFFALGGGIKVFRGTGAEPPFQPLSNLVVLTHASQMTPLISAGAGVKFSVSRRALVRLDFRDYLSPVPDKLIATPPASATKGWLHDFVLQVGVSTVF